MGDKNEWPWLAALLRPSSTSSGQYCGASLISSTHVLTAAHCIEPFQQNQIRVRLGEYKFDDNDGDEDTFKLAWMKMHANYNAKTFENDIAILKLDRKVTFSDSIKAACLPFADVDYVDKKATVAGWGTIYFGGPTSQQLLEVDVGIWKNSDCANNYRRLNRNVLDTMMCAGDATGRRRMSGRFRWASKLSSRSRSTLRTMWSCFLGCTMCRKRISWSLYTSF